MKACPACNSRYEDDVRFCDKDGTPVVEDAQTREPSLVGQVIADRYRLVRKLGEGGMGEVYEAEHIHIEKRVALKLLRSEILSNQEAVTRFRQEARSASSIGHPNIIQIDDFGALPDGRVYLTMEFLQGAPLSELIKQPMPLERALHILIQTCHGLAAAHAKGIVHRDMKPENIFVTVGRDGREVPKILDFGIAKVSGADGNQNLTRTGTIFGTPFYMAPEQALGQPIDHRADIYAVGIILYEVFCGTVPFKAESFMGILTQHITAAPPPPSLVAAQTGRVMPPELEGVILQALRKDPAERYQTMNELVVALTEVYRKYVGRGMTAPLAAAPRSPSQFVPAQSQHMSVSQIQALANAPTAMSTPMPGPMPTPMPGPMPTPMPGPMPGPMSTPMPSAMPGPMSTPMPSVMPTPMPPGTGTVPRATPPPMGGQAPGFPSSTSPPYPGTTVPAPKGRGGLWAAVVAVLLLGGGGAAWYGMMGPGKRDGSGTRAGGASAQTTGHGDGREPGGAPPQVTTTGPTQPVQTGSEQPAGNPGSGGATEPSKVHIMVDSIPRGATILRGGVEEGKTPTLVTVDKGVLTTLTLRLSGYEERTLTVDGSNLTVKETLEKTRSGSRHERRGDRKGGPVGTGPGSGKNGKPDDSGLVDDDELE